MTTTTTAEATFPAPASVPPRALHELSVAEAGALLRAGRLSATELTRYTLARIEELNPRLHAFVTITAERALRDAARADRELAAGLDRGPMHGIPYALKDIFDTRGIRTTSHSWLMADHVPQEDAEAEARLAAGGGVLVGKLATHEFALGGPSPELPFPPARNPWNTDHFTGASSSGAGAAVAAGLVRVAIGSDTSGSVRGPACHCGTVGLKPTYGLVSRRGAFPLSYALDHIGPLGWTVADTALATQVIAGYDPLDPGSVRREVPDLTAGLGLGVEGLRIAYSPCWFRDDAATSPEVTAAIERVLGELAARGAEVGEVELPPYRLFNACGRVIMAAEAYAVHETDLRTRPEKYGRYTYQRIAPAVGLSAADLVQAHRMRQELARALHRAVFERYDVLVTATGLAPAPRLDAFPTDWPPPRELTAMQTIPFNVTGHPALALPTGLSASGLPLGMQIAGRPFDEPTVLRVGAAVEAITTHPTRRPPTSATAPGPDGRG
ncbi:amidase [Streptomyces sp. XM83C]|uniref:Amidase n=1 Tax=Streptomyces thermocoprophilus TaxID=78356 RepID=A0ABV5VCY0_9ACTN|nr:amidase [Streptomyces sp. XM83C]MCK1819770.1 amidase [Streptomyces sp. XM83C]